MCGVIVCGVCSFSFTPSSSINARHLMRALLEAVEPRGREATGYAAFNPEGRVDGNNAPIKATEFCKSRREFRIDPAARIAIGHTRLATQGTTANPLNNHPVYSYRSAGTAVAAVHNGSVWNDDEMFAAFNLPRYARVDSEAIPAMIAEFGSGMFASIFSELQGGIATCWLDEASPDTLHCVRAWDSPMMVAAIKTVDPLGFEVEGVIVASTVVALTAGLTAIGLSWEMEGVDQFEIGEGEYFKVTAGVWDRMILPFELPNMLSRWGSGWRRGNAATQGYSATGSTYGTSNPGKPSKGDKSKVGASTGTGIGSGKVESGKPSTYIATADSVVEVLDSEGNLISLEVDTPAVLDGTAEWSGFCEAGTDDEAQGSAAAQEYCSWWQDQDRTSELCDLADRFKDAGYVPTINEVIMLTAASEVERDGLGLRRAFEAGNSDFMWHMEVCEGGDCVWQNTDCPTLTNFEDEGEADRCAQIWGNTASLVGS